MGDEMFGGMDFESQDSMDTGGFENSFTSDFDTMPDYGSSYNPESTASMLGQYQAPDRLTYDPEGGVEVSELARKQARYGMLSKVLMGAAQSLFNRDPRYAIEAGGSAGDEYQRRMNEARAKKVAKHTMEWNEIEMRAKLDQTKDAAEQRKIMLAEMNDKLKREELSRKWIGRGAMLMAKDVEKELNDAYNAGELAQIGSAGPKESLATYKSKLKTAGYLFQAGDSIGAIKILQEVEAGLPQRRRDAVKARLGDQQHLVGLYNEMNPDRPVELVNGQIVDAREQKLEESAKSAQIAASGASVRASDMSVKVNQAQLDALQGAGARAQALAAFGVRDLDKSAYDDASTALNNLRASASVVPARGGVSKPFDPDRSVTNTFGGLVTNATEARILDQAIRLTASSPDAKRAGVTEQHIVDAIRAGNYSLVAKTLNDGMTKLLPDENSQKAIARMLESIGMGKPGAKPVVSFRNPKG